MWAMTSFGILMPAIRPLHTVPIHDDRTMQIRTRRAKDLDILRAQYMQGQLGANIHTPDKDYEYRAYCRPEDFASAMARMILEIDYLKFKPTTDRYADNKLHTCYNRIWTTVMTELSTKHHQDDYWHSGKPYSAPATSYYSGTAAKPHTGGTGTSEKVYTGGTVSRSGKASNRGISLEKKGTPLMLSRTAEYDTEKVHDLDIAGVDRWLGYDTGPRNTAADRDTYEPEVGDWAGYADALPYGRSSAALYAEIDALLDAQYEDETIDHTKCPHAPTGNARSRCRRRHRRSRVSRIDALRGRIANLPVSAFPPGSSGWAEGDPLR